jgi:hypothetical protein
VIDQPGRSHAWIKADRLGALRRRGALAIDHVGELPPTERANRNAASDAGDAEPCALLSGESHHPATGGDSTPVAKQPDDLKGDRNSRYPIEPSALRYRVEMRPDQHEIVRAPRPGEAVADRIDVQPQAELGGVLGEHGMSSPLLGREREPRPAAPSIWTDRSDGVYECRNPFRARGPGNCASAWWRRHESGALDCCSTMPSSAEVKRWR